MSEVQPLSDVDTIGRRDFTAFMTVVKHLRRGKRTSDLTLAAAKLTGAEWYRAESTGGPDEARGLDDGVHATVQLHLAVHAAHSSLLGCNDCHLHLPVIDQGVKDGLDVIH